MDEANDGDLERVSTRFIVRDCNLSRELGVTANEVTNEEYRIVSVGHNIVIVGHDIGDNPKRRPIHPNASPITLFAVSHLLDRYLGIRWLWPVELGKLVPKRRSITLPRLDITDRPELEACGFMIALPRNRGVAGTSNKIHDRMVSEAYLWSDRHRLGTRSSLKFAHAFTQWCDAHHEKHPIYFAVPSDGQPQRGPRGVNSAPAVRPSSNRSSRIEGSPGGQQRGTFASTTASVSAGSSSYTSPKERCPASLDTSSRRTQQDSRQFECSHPNVEDEATSPDASAEKDSSPRPLR